MADGKHSEQKNKDDRSRVLCSRGKQPRLFGVSKIIVRIKSNSHTPSGPVKRSESSLKDDSVLSDPYGRSGDGFEGGISLHRNQCVALWNKIQSPLLSGSRKNILV